MAKNTHYAVWIGRKPGVYKSWLKTKEQVDGYSYATYKGFTSERLAFDAFHRGPDAGHCSKPPSVPKKKKRKGRKSKRKFVDPGPKPSGEYFCTDAAGSWSSNRAEYRGLMMPSGDVAFAVLPIESLSINTAETLAIIEGLRWMKENGVHLPLYTDSKIAMGWIKRGEFRLGAAASERLTPFAGETIKKARAWLLENPPTVDIRKWHTRSWGEIPADYGRK